MSTGTEHDFVPVLSRRAGAKLRARRDERHVGDADRRTAHGLDDDALQVRDGLFTGGHLARHTQQHLLPEALDVAGAPIRVVPLQRLYHIGERQPVERAAATVAAERGTVSRTRRRCSHRPLLHA